jgi:hypothetical protein
MSKRGDPDRHYNRDVTVNWADIVKNSARPILAVGTAIGIVLWALGGHAPLGSSGGFQFKVGPNSVEFGIGGSESKGKDTDRVPYLGTEQKLALDELAQNQDGCKARLKQSSHVRQRTEKVCKLTIKPT